jgi:hypothetical protein
MNRFNAAALAVILATAGGSMALAQTTAMPAPMAKDQMAHDDMTLSKGDMKIAEACRKMTAEMAARSAKCQKLAKKHPDAMGQMSTGPMSTGAMSSGAMSKPAH